MAYTGLRRTELDSLRNILPLKTDKVNPYSCISSGLKGLLVGTGTGLGKDILTGSSSFIVVGSPIATPHGSSIGSAITSTSGLTSARANTDPAINSNWKPSSPILTLAVCFTPLVVTASSVNIGGVGAGSSSGYHISARGTSNGSIAASINNGVTNRAVYYNLAASGSYSINNINVAVLTYDGSAIRLYLNGKAGAAESVYNISIASLSYDAIYSRTGILGLSESTGLGGGGHWMGLWDRALSVEEIRYMFNNPWDLFEQEQLYIPEYYTSLSSVPTLSNLILDSFTPSTARLRVDLNFP